MSRPLLVIVSTLSLSAMATRAKAAPVRWLKTPDRWLACYKPLGTAGPCEPPLALRAAKSRELDRLDEECAVATTQLEKSAACKVGSRSRWRVAIWMPQCRTPQPHSRASNDRPLRRQNVKRLMSSRKVQIPRRLRFSISALPIRFWLVVPVMLGGIAATAHAQGTVCSQPAKAFPCVNQPKEKDDTVVGQLAASPANLPAAANITLSISGFVPMTSPTLDGATFTFKLPGSLGPKNVVTVTINEAGGGTTGPVPVLAGAPPPNLCTKTTPAANLPCVNQPIEGDTKLTGTMTSEDGNVEVYLDGKKLALKPVRTGNTFTISGLPKLCTCNKLEIVQTVPALKAGATAPSTGIVPIKVNTKKYNLSLTIPAASESLDFGHQAMETESTGQQVTITNATDSPVDLVDPSTTVTSTNFRVPPNSCGATLQPKAACTFKVVFAPFKPGRVPGQADTDFIVIVPKSDQSALEAFQMLDSKLHSARGDIGDLSYQIATLKANTNPSQAKVTAAAAKYSEVATRYSLDNESAQGKQSLAPLSQSDAVNSAVTRRKTDQRTFVEASAENRIAYLDSALRNVQGAQNQAVQELEANFQVVAVSGSPDHWKYPLTRAVVGVALAAPTSQSIKQAYFVDFDLLAPLTLPGMAKYKNQDPLENRLWLWFNPRITSLPQAANFSALSTINETASFLDSETSKGTLGDIQGLDASGGIEIAIVKPRDGIPWWAEYANTQARLAPSFILGGGMSTPFSTSNTDVVSQVNQGICDAFSLYHNQTPPVGAVSSQAGLVCTITAPATSPTILRPNGAAPAQFIDFYTPERSRFFRKAYGGIRLKTYFFSRAVKADCRPAVTRNEYEGDCDGLYDIFPGTIDLTFGKDEAVSHGAFSTWLFRMDAVYPLPFYQGIHLFASMYTELKGNTANQPFNAYAINTPTTGSNNDANTFRYGVHPLDRDYFQVGIGVDLIQVFKKAANGGQPNKNAPAAPAAATAGGSPSS